MIEPGRFFTLVTAIALTVGIAGCGSDGGSTEDAPTGGAASDATREKLEATAWGMSGITRGDIKLVLPEDAATPQLDLSGDEATFSNACDLEPVEAVLGEEAIDFGEAPELTAECDQPERTWVEALASVTGGEVPYRFSGDELILEGPDRSLRFTPMSGKTEDLSDGNEAEVDPKGLRPATKADLSGEFVSVSIEGKSLPEDVRVQVTFDDGTISAGLGCNGIRGEYDIDDGVLKTGNLAMTMMGCPGDLDKAETWLNRFLGKPLEARAGSETVTLADQKVTLTLRQAPKGEVPLP